MYSFLKESTFHQLLPQVFSKPQLSNSVITKWVRIMDLHKTNNLPFSSMIWVCHSLTIGVIKLLYKLLDNWCNKMVFIGLIKLKEVTLRILKICHLLELWIIQEEVEMTFQTDWKDNFSFSTWFYHCLLKVYMVQSLSSSSELMRKTQVYLIKSKKLLKI
jgi:hypothetical protein